VHASALRDSPHVNDKVKLSEEEIQNLSPMRRPIVNKPLGIAYGTGELPAMIASSRDYHAYRSQGHVPGDLIPIANTNHFTILDELRRGVRYTTGKGAVASPTASPLLPFNWTQVIKVSPGEQLSAVSNEGVAGTLVVVELS